ncbi:type I polyketide synthase [Streptomyces sp. NPDC020845]|uniref:type I polyketide synthase n=1 Tax=Streptomyces sp. NPDC020845 TaxID=3365096 RepID=UPI0037927BC4
MTTPMGSQSGRQKAADPDGDLLQRLLLEKYEPIAIVGIGLRLPDGNDTRESLAEFLRSGRDGTGPIPSDRWDVAAFESDDPAAKGTIRTRGGGFLQGIDRFDPAFFGISPKEADYVDPQQRLLLETAWEALEDAGLDAHALRGGDGGVYVGISSADYMIAAETLPYEAINGYLGTGTAHSAASGRLSYVLGWHGPCASFDTACSSSLVALHTAVQDLRQRQCDIALCAGVNLVHHPQAHIVTTDANMLAPDGRCKTFDDRADGYARSEGCGVLALKRLSDAQRDGDRILALVRGSAIRQDGEGAGLTVPNGSSQQRVMRAALLNSAVRPEDIQYVEAHGTGTALGDPIELSAIGKVFAESHSPGAPVFVASGKTNLGHAEAAAGVSGIIKVALQLGEGLIYPHLNMDIPSTHVAWDELPVAVPREPVPWPAGTRRALVNSFGFAGTIASAVIEQAPASDPVREESARPRSGTAVFTLSARTRKALGLQVERYQRYLADHPDTDVEELCHASNVLRAHHASRIAGVVGGPADLEALLAGHLRETKDTPQQRKVAFLFSGQGSQYPGMAAGLYRSHRVFRDTVDVCDRLFAEHLDGPPVRGVMFGEGQTAGLLDQTRYTQPALFTLEYALAELWKSWGIRPDAVIGHSIGEVAAATVAGVFPLPDAIGLVAARARLMQSVSAPGGMMAVRASGADIAPSLDQYPGLSLAALNAPDQCVVSGGTEPLEAMAAELTERGLRTKRLPVSHAFHSPLMDEVLEEFRGLIAGVGFQEPEITLISNLSGDIADVDEVCSAAYWARLIREPVDFAGGIRTLTGLGPHAMVEIGPGRSLINSGRACVTASRHLWVASLGSAAEQDRSPYEAAAQLYTAGLPLSWRGFHEGRPKPRLTLPAYSFDRKRYWLPDFGKGLNASAHHPLLGAETTTEKQRSSSVREFANRISAGRPDYLVDHMVVGQVVFPAAGFIELLIAAVDAVHGHIRFPIDDMRIHEPLLLSDDAISLRTRVRTTEDGGELIEILSVSDDAGIERLHVTAAIGKEGQDAVPLEDGSDLMEELAGAEAGDEQRDQRIAELYADFADSGMDYGPRFRLIESFTRRGDNLVTAEITGPAGVTTEHLPPAILDSALQTLATIIQPGLPVRLRSFRLLSRPRGATLRSVVRLLPAQQSTDVDFVADVVLYDGRRVVCVLNGLELRRMSSVGVARRRMFYQTQWIEAPASATPVPGRRIALLHSGLEENVSLAEEAERTGTSLAFASDLAQLPDLLAQGPTDLCWFWQPGERRAAVPGPGVAGLRAECERQYTELLELVGLLETCGFGPDQRLWLVTRGGQWFPQDEADDGSRLSASSLWGFGAVLLSEYPNHRVTLLDLPVGESDPATVLGELLRGEPDEFQIAYRDGRRHVRRLVPSTPEERIGTEEPITTEPEQTPVDGDHTYLITGGLGGLGLLTARTLVDRGARHLALVSRRAPDDQEFQKVRQTLGEQVSVRVYAADIAEPAAVDTLFKSLAKEGPALGGVVHAAGVLSDRPVNSQDWDNIDKVFRAKVYGSWLLHQATADLPEVRFFIGYGSSSAVLGQAGQCNYAAGNAFLDALMHWRCARGLPGTAIDWGPWAEVGMAAALDEAHRQSFERQGMVFIQPRDGARALATLLDSPVPQIVVGECDWTTYAATRPLSNALYEGLARPRDNTVRTLDVDQLAGLPEDARRQALADLVRGTVAKVLRFDATGDIPADTPFTHLGLDSLAAVDVKNGLEAALHTSLSASITMDYPTTDLLVEHLDALLRPGDGGTGGPGEPSGGLDSLDAEAELAALKDLG